MHTYKDLLMTIFKSPPGKHNTALIVLFKKEENFFEQTMQKKTNLKVRYSNNLENCDNQCNALIDIEVD